MPNAKDISQTAMEPFLVITPTGYTKHYYAGTERIAAQIGKGKFNNVNSSIANADSTAAKLTAVNGIAPYLASYATPKFTYLNTLLALNTTAKEKYNTHTDHLGSSAWVTDSLGVAVQHLAYLPWGETFVSQKTGNFSTIYTFSGKERDDETGYSYFGQRFYDSQLAIWLSVDPMRQKYPQFSPFVYCANNPVRLVDPNGEEIDLSQMDEGQRIRLIEALSYITGLKLSVDSEGLLHYANLTGKEEGSASARNDLITAIDMKNEDGSPYHIDVYSSMKSAGGQYKNGKGGGIRLSTLYAASEDNSTNGMGMGFMHELRHAAFGDKDPADQSTSASYIKQGDFGLMPKEDAILGGAVKRVNVYRGELEMPKRMAYPTNPKNGMIPFYDKTNKKTIWKKMY